MHTFLLLFVTLWLTDQGCAQFRVESTLAHSTQFSFELTFELIFECATLWMPIHWAEWGFIGLVRTIPFNSHSRIDSLLPKSSHGWECECARMAFELDTTLLFTSTWMPKCDFYQRALDWKKIQKFHFSCHVCVQLILSSSKVDSFTFPNVRKQV